MTPEQKIQDFIRQDTEKIAEILEKYPRHIPIHVIAEWWGCNDETLRRAMERNSTFGLCYRRDGGANRVFIIPTGAFTRWYMGIKA